MIKYNNFVYERKKTLSPFENQMVLICLKANPLHSSMHYAKFDGNWLCVFGEEDFQILSKNFQYSIIISLLK